MPAHVDADQWLHAYHGHTFARKVKATGQVVAVRVDAELGQFVVEADGQEVQRLATKGIGVGRLPFTTFLELGCAEARTLRSLAYARLGQQRQR